MSEQQGAVPQMRPLGVGEVLDASIKLVRRHFRALALVTLLVSIPIEAFGGAVTAATTDFCEGPGCVNEFETDTVYVWEDDVAYYGGQALIVLLAILQYVVVQVACFRILAEGYLGRSVGAGDSMRYALSRGAATLWLTFLLFVGLIFAFVLLVLPAIWLGIAWSVAIPVLLVERTGGAAALRRSFSLVRGFWWATFLKLLVSTLLIGVATAAIGGALYAVLLFAVEEASYAGLVIKGVINVVTQVITTPFLAAVATLIYFDLRVRKEGFDLAVLAERMGGGDATEPAPVPASFGGKGETDAFGRPASPASGWTPPATSSGSPGPWAPPRTGGDSDAWAPPRPAPAPQAPDEWGAPRREDASESPDAWGAPRPDAPDEGPPGPGGSSGA